MKKIKYFMLAACVLGSAVAFAANDDTIQFQNSVRVGYDDNLYQARDVNAQESAFITDILNIKGTLTFSDRSDMVLYWQPEFRYRFDADNKFVSYQDLYAKLSHAMSQRTFLEISDRFRYQDQNGQTDSLLSTFDENYIENDLMGSVGYTLNSLSQVKVGAGYAFRTWDDSNYGDTLGNDYDQLKANGSYLRNLKADTTIGLVGVNYMDHEYAGTRGGFDSTTIYGGVDHTFNPNMFGSAQLGYSFSNIEDSFGNSQDASNPFVQAGMDYKPTERTAVNGTLSYSLSQSQNSYYNASDTFDLGLGVQHDLTGKISLSGTLSYIMAYYDSAYARVVLPDAEEDFIRVSLRGSYQINRNNFVDLGYEYSDRDSDSILLQAYTRNRIDFGWRVNF